MEDGFFLVSDFSPACLCHPRSINSCIFITVFCYACKIKACCCETETWCLSIQFENINGGSGKFKEPTLGESRLS